MDVKVIEACCEPVLTEPLAEGEADELAGAFKVLADPIRLRLLSLVANAPGGELCACDVVDIIGRSQPTVSHHLSILAGAGLLQREQRGKWAYYRVDPDRVGVLRDALTV
jgi:ArsR family transcriptional regulator, arsenate/arsenite/antimonite-responsive transcriptional repressor